MREIKFRAWDLERKEMTTDFVVGAWDGRLMAPGQAGWTSLHNRTLSPIMQFTGLKDKNGKEIYEGDIVEVFNICNESEGLWEVYWGSDSWGLRRGKEGYDNGDYYAGWVIHWDTFYSKEHEGGEKGGVLVRDNIHQNPDLLKG